MTSRTVRRNISYNPLIDNQETIVNSNEKDSEDYDYIERDIRDPLPTVSVPFKIIKTTSKSYSNQAIDYQNTDDDFDNSSYIRRNINTASENNDWLSTDHQEW